MTVNASTSFFCTEALKNVDQHCELALLSAGFAGGDPLHMWIIEAGTML